MQKWTVTHVGYSNTFWVDQKSASFSLVKKVQWNYSWGQRDLTRAHQLLESTNKESNLGDGKVSLPYEGCRGHKRVAHFMPLPFLSSHRLHLHIENKSKPAYFKPWSPLFWWTQSKSKAEIAWPTQKLVSQHDFPLSGGQVLISTFRMAKLAESRACPLSFQSSLHSHESLHMSFSFGF